MGGEVTLSLIALAQEISTEFGTGNYVADLLVLLFSLVAVALVVATLAVLRGMRSEPTPVELSPDRLRALGGKIERLERALNDLRTETFRELSLLRESLANRPTTGRGDYRAPAWQEPAGVSPAAAEAVLPPARPLAEPKKEVADETRAEPQPVAPRRSFGFFRRLKGLFSASPTLSKAQLADVEETLIGADVGMATTQAIIRRLEEVGAGGGVSEETLRRELQQQLEAVLREGAPADPAIVFTKRSDGPTVIMLVGVNGAGKTTTAAKLAQQARQQGARVLLVAADTFRAAAVEQLATWGERLSVPVVRGAPDAKPQTVVFDGVKRGVDEGFDVVIIDTAGRLHTKSSLMQELEGVRNSIARHQPSAPHEVLLVVDGSSGQNALVQAKEFHEAVKLTGVVVTKLDGTPKGGIVVGIKREFGIPVRYVGLGERPEDLVPFSPAPFVAELLTDGDEPEVGESGDLPRRRRRVAV